MSNAYDLAILGSGISGSVLGTILARKGYRVAILDGGVHPKFAIGESTIPQTSQLMSMLARDHQVPELENFGGAAVGYSNGIKKSFGFCYHEQGKDFDPAHGNMFGNIWRVEHHLFRQDVDAYLFHLALRYGCEARQGCRVSDIQFEDAGALIRTDGGETLRARFVVDGTGPGSMLAKQLDLRETPTTLKTRTRSMFTHVMDVKPFEQCVDNPFQVGWSQGTTHHVFHGGWMWIIPFNNTKGSTNPLISIGLTLDLDMHPVRDDISPAEEFAGFLAQLPSVAKQFEDMIVVRPWVRVPKLQYSSHTTVGDRFCLMSNAAGFVDPLFSRGLTNTFEVIRHLVPKLCTALDENEFSKEHFESIDVLQKRSFRYADELIHGSYKSWANYELWNAWLRPWAIGLHALESAMGSHIIMGKLSRFKLVKDPISSEFESEGFRAFFEACTAVMDQFSSGSMSAEQATEALWRIIGGYDFTIPLPGTQFAGHEQAFKARQYRDMFLGMPELHQRWLDDLHPSRRATDEGRKHTRFDSGIAVRFPVGSGYLTRHAENVSAGGLFVRDAQGLQPGSEISVQVDLPGHESFEVRVRVVNIIDEDKAAERKVSPGAGLALVEVPEGFGLALMSHLGRLARASEFGADQ